MKERRFSQGKGVAPAAATTGERAIAPPSIAEAPRATRQRRLLPRPLLAWLEMPWRERWRWLSRKLREIVFRTTRIESVDRVLLEQRWLAAYAADPAVRTLLFVGCEWYTRDYAALFDPDRARFRTIDIDPRKARHGSIDHILAPLQEVARHVDRASVDVIVCNGVYGYGIDDREQLEAALRAAHAVLRPQGTLLLGWNDVPALAPFDPSEVAIDVGFEAATGPLAEWRVRTDTPARHTFDTYIKRE